MNKRLLLCAIGFAIAFAHNAEGAFVNQQLVCDGANANSGTITTKDAGGATRTFDLNTTSTAQCAAVKAASTAPAATDPAMVVSLSQNAGLGSSTTPMQVSLANNAANTNAVKVNVVSGGVASGGLASGSMVDLLTVIGTKNAGTAAANSMLSGAVYNSTPLTLADTQQASLQADVNGFLKVNVVAGGGSGGTSLADGATFTQGTTAVNPIGCLFINSYTGITTGKAGVVSCQNTGALNVNVNNTNANITPADGASNPTTTSPVIGFGEVWNGSTWDRMPGTTAGVKVNPGTPANWAVVATGAAPPANAVYNGANASGATGGLVAGMVQCDSTAVYDASTSGSTELKALTSGRSIYVCGYSIFSGGTVNVKLIYGTGTACATGSANMTGAYQLTAQTGIVDGAPYYRGMKTASANALCINTSAGVAVQALVYYSVI